MALISDLLAGGRTFSFEFFPPKTDAASFVSVTYGAGGSTRQRTHEVVTWVRRETSITPMAHLTCAGHRRSEVGDILRGYHEAGIDNILALAGDPPKDDAGPAPTDYRYAAELVEDIRATGPFSIGVAAHPELHPRSPDRESDRRHLATKLRLADFAITQFFFECDHYLRLVDELSALGVDRPVVPGVMPVTNRAQVQRMADLSGAAFPGWLADRLAAVDDPEEVRRIGVEVATALCSALLEAGAPGLHFYTLNRSTATREIYANLGLPVTAG
jgi:methylenetetrahydrofolate reductase (NADPH)